MNYGIGVSFFAHIKAVAFSVLFTGLTVSTAGAANLTSKEVNVCPSLRVCIDIIQRASEQIGHERRLKIISHYYSTGILFLEIYSF